MSRSVIGRGVVLILLVLICGSAFAASSGWTRYTFPAARWQVAKPGTMTVWFPAGWHVTTAWGIEEYSSTPMAYDGSRGASWWVGASLENPSTTISDVRARMLGWPGTTMWGKGTPMRVYVSDSYLTLPMGKAWRLTLALVPPKGKTNFKLSYERDYTLDRGIVETIYGKKHLFEGFTVICSAHFCKTHNGQLAAIMNSVRITP